MPQERDLTFLHGVIHCEHEKYFYTDMNIEEGRSVAIGKDEKEERIATGKPYLLKDGMSLSLGPNIVLKINFSVEFLSLESLQLSFIQLNSYSLQQRPVK